MMNWLSAFGPDSIGALDIRARRLSFFDSRGRFLGSVALEPRADLPYPGPVGFFEDGSLLVKQGALGLGAEGPTRVERPDEHLYRYALDGSMLSDLGAFPGTELDIAPTGRSGPDGAPMFAQTPREFGRGTAFAAHGRRFYVADNRSYEIQVHDLQAGLVLLIRKEHVSRPVTEEDIRRPREARLAKEDDPDRRRWIARAYELLPDPPETMPAFATDIRIDPVGNLWVREYTAMEGLGAEWDVFTPDGLWLGSVSIPSALALLSIGLDHVLMLRTDDHGVQYVQIHRLLKGDE